MDKYDELIDRFMNNGEIKRIYDNYIIDEITFKEWVDGHVDDLLLQTGKRIHLGAERRLNDYLAGYSRID
jgi:hypothetical protein